MFTTEDGSMARRDGIAWMERARGDGGIPEYTWTNRAVSMLKYYLDKAVPLDCKEVSRLELNPLKYYLNKFLNAARRPIWILVNDESKEHVAN